MLTGDKLETAENIGMSCKLIQPNFEKIYLRVNEQDQDEEMVLRKEFEEIKGNLMSMSKGVKKSIIVEGPKLLKISQFKELEKLYVTEIFNKCDSVVCCRMSPK
jgi:phospholipid-transporting ATPase